MKPEAIIGRSVIVGMTFVNANNEVLEIKDFAGQVIEISDEKGIVICNHDSKQAIALPLNFDAFKPAVKGNYTLKQSGLKIMNPDLTCEMTIIKK